MSINDDGDIIRACGFLSIYFGNLEEEISDLFDIVAMNYNSSKVEKRFRISEKLKFIKNSLIDNFPHNNISDFDKNLAIKILENSLIFSKKRNEIIHSSLIGGTDGRSILKKKDGSEVEITSAEIYDLANKIFAMNGSILSIQFTVMKMSRWNQ